MLIDGRLVPREATLRADVAVIGAGPAGITVSQELAATGLHVLLLEASGRHHTSADDDALAGDGSGVPFPLVRSRHRGFGGTSTHWTPETGLRVRQLDAIDFEARPGRPNDSWPFGPDALQPFYDRAHQAIGLVSGYEPNRWFGEASPTPLAWQSGPELAMFQFADHDCFTRRYADVVATPIIDLVLNASVRTIELDPDGAAADSVAMVCPGGNRFSVTAKTFVLACGGIDNARILLASPGRDGRGVGNEHDNVGRYFMDHLSIDTGIIEPVGPAISADVFGHHSSPTGRYQPMLWLGGEWTTRAGLPNAAFWVDEIDPAYVSAGIGAARKLRAAYNSFPRRDLAKHSVGTLRGSPQLAAFATRRILRQPSRRRILAMRIMTEQLPDRESRILLSPRLDKLGIPRVDLDWRITAADLEVVVAHQQLLGRLLEDRGVARLTSRFDPAEHPSPIMSNFHHLGSTRMHVDPEHGVVDAECRVHTVANLYVVGGSVFPTGGYLNPTLTIIALAIRAADAIVRDHRPVSVRSAETG